MPTTPNVELTPDPLDPREETGGQPATPVEPVQPIEVPTVPESSAPNPSEAVPAKPETSTPAGATPSEPIMPATTEPTLTEPMPPMQPEVTPEPPNRTIFDKLFGRNKPPVTPPADVEQELNK